MKTPNNQLELFPLPIFYKTDFETDCKAWYEKTGVKFYIDGFMSAICGSKQVDIIKIDRELERKYNYKNQSLKDFVNKFFGADYEYLFTKYSQII